MSIRVGESRQARNGHEARWGEVTMTRLRFGLWMVDVR